MKINLKLLAVLLAVSLLLGSVFASSTSDVSSRDSKEGSGGGFFSRLLSLFHIGVVAESDVGAEQVSSEGVVGSQEVSDAEVSSDKQASATVASVQGSRVGVAHRIEGSIGRSVDALGAVAAGACCHVTICKKDGLEFICPGDDCSSRYGDCRDVSCLPSCADGVYTCHNTFMGQWIDSFKCENSLDNCEGQGVVCECGWKDEVSDESSTRSYSCVKQVDVSSVRTSLDVRCDGTFKECQSQYSDCKDFRCPHDLQTCGMKIPSPLGDGVVVAPVPCEGDFNDCQEMYDHTCVCEEDCVDGVYTCHNTFRGHWIDSFRCDAPKKECEGQGVVCECGWKDDVGSASPDEESDGIDVGALNPFPEGDDALGDDVLPHQEDPVLDDVLAEGSSVDLPVGIDSSVEGSASEDADSSHDEAEDSSGDDSSAGGLYLTDDSVVHSLTFG